MTAPVSLFQEATTGPEPGANRYSTLAVTSPQDISAAEEIEPRVVRFSKMVFVMVGDKLENIKMLINSPDSQQMMTLQTGLFPKDFEIIYQMLGHDVQKCN